jgi:hypothetical protein
MEVLTGCEFEVFTVTGDNCLLLEHDALHHCLSDFPMMQSNSPPSLLKVK